MDDTGRLRAYLEGRMPAALAMLREMVEINSFTENREGVNRLGRLTAGVFAPLGFRAEYVPSTTSTYGDHLVLTRPGGSGKSVVWISHLDTVFPPEEEERQNFRWRVEGDWIYGPGTNDIKGGTVMMWLVLQALQAQFPEMLEAIEWRLFWDASEETTGEDFSQLVKARLDSGTLAALVFEGEGRQEGTLSMVVARKGRATWRITASGRGAHAGGAHHLGANAIVQLARTVEHIAAMTDYERELTFNVGTIQGGTVLNRVPHSAVAEGEFRTFDSAVYARAKDALLSIDGPGTVSSPSDGHVCEVRGEILSESRPWPRNEATDRLFALWRRTGEELGIPVRPECRGGLSDGNPLWDVVPTLDGLGPWGEHTHCSEWSEDGSKRPEFVDVTSFVPKALLNVMAMVRLIRS